MENFPIVFSGTSLEIHGIPNATKLVALEGKPAKRLADLQLHRQDLEFAEDCLVELSTRLDAPDHNDFVKEALWRAAVTHFYKCFGADARSQLSRDAVLKGEPAAAKEVFERFKNLRNAHLIHDENSYLQCQAMAALNDAAKSYKVEKVVCSSVRKQTLQQESFSSFRHLVTFTKNWFIADFDQLAQVITDDLEKLPYAELAAKATPEVTAASVADIGIFGKK